LPQFSQFRVAAVYVADHVERAGFGAQVVAQRLDHDPRCRHLGFVVQHVYPAEALLGEEPHGAAQFRALSVDHARAEVPVRSVGVAPHTLRFRRVQHDRHRQHVVFPGQRDERGAASRCTFVASTTVIRPAASRLPAT